MQPEKYRDREVYSRQELVLGAKGLSSLFSSSLCIVGLDGLGAEIAKNALLGGVPRLSLCDAQQVSRLDVSTSICFRYKAFSEFNGTRAQESSLFLPRFNPSASITSHTSFSVDLCKELRPDLVVVCNQTWDETQRIADVCRENSIKVIIAFTGGLYYLFAQDLGEYTYADVQQSKQKEVFLFEVTDTSGPHTLNQTHEIAQRDAVEGDTVSGEVAQEEAARGGIQSEHHQTEHAQLTTDYCGAPTMQEANDHPEQNMASMGAELANENSPETKEEPTHTERTYTAKYKDEYFSLEEGDLLELLEKTGEMFGTASIKSLNYESSTLVLVSNQIIGTEVFIQYLPRANTLAYPSLQEVQGSQPVPKLAAGLKAFSKFLSTSSSVATSSMHRNQDMFERFFSLVEGATEEDKEFFWKFYCTSFTATVPINSILGGIISEQVVKVLSHCFAPIKGWKGKEFFYYLFTGGDTVEDYIPEDNEFGMLYGSQILTFGKKYQEALAAKSALVVGAGALGNEIVKGAAMIGLSTSEGSSLIVIDNDFVVTSNLSRQMCFEESDMHAPKADTLCHKVNSFFNSRSRLEPINLKLTHATEDAVGHKRLKQVDVFISALDNVAARQTLERIAHMYKKPMIDGGTDGFDGTQYNFIPLQTAEYYSPHDRVEAVQSCTPKAVVSSKDDVVHNAKIYYERLVNKILDDADPPVHDLFEIFSDDMKLTCVSESVQPLPIAATEDQRRDFIICSKRLQDLKKVEKLLQYFDKDDIAHIRFLKVICDIISHTFGVPPVDVIEMRQKGGNIIPSIISSTAVIAGFMLLNTLQLSKAQPTFVNAAFDQSLVILTRPSNFSSDRQFILHLDKLRLSTTFEQVTHTVPSSIPSLYRIIFHGNVVTTLPQKGIAALSGKSFGKYLASTISLGSRKKVMVEFTFQRRDRELMTLEQETKFLIVTLSKKLRNYRDSLVMQEHFQEQLLGHEQKYRMVQTEREELEKKNNTIESELKVARDRVRELQQARQQTENEVAQLKVDLEKQQRQLQTQAAGYHTALQQAQAREMKLSLKKDEATAEMQLERDQSDALCLEFHHQSRLMNKQAETAQQQLQDEKEHAHLRIMEMEHERDRKEAVIKEIELEVARKDAVIQEMVIERRQKDVIMEEMAIEGKRKDAVILEQEQTAQAQVAEIIHLQNKEMQKARSGWVSKWLPSLLSGAKAEENDHEQQTTTTLAPSILISPLPGSSSTTRPALTIEKLPIDPSPTISEKQLQARTTFQTPYNLLPPKQKRLSKTPLTLPNRGNTCYLASATQLLYAGYVGSNRTFMHHTSSMVGASLRKLFENCSVSDWDRFVQQFFQSPAFVKGQQDDSGKAFGQIAKAEWPQPHLRHPHTISKTYHVVPANKCTRDPVEKRILDNYILYSGADDEDVNIVQQLSATYTRERPCVDGCGSLKERTEVKVWPEVLFMVTTSDASFLQAAKLGLTFPGIKSAKYELVGVSLHSGYSVSSGHYTALVKLEGIWWYCSDAEHRRQDIDKYHPGPQDSIQLLVFSKVMNVW